MKRNEVVPGLLLIAIGLMFLAANYDAVPALHFGRLWPVILIVLGGAKILFPDGGSRVQGLPLLLVGGVFLAHNYDVMSLRDSWPLFIVSAGISVLAGTCQDRTPSTSEKTGGMPR